LVAADPLRKLKPNAMRIGWLHPNGMCITLLSFNVADMIGIEDHSRGGQTSHKHGQTDDGAFQIRMDVLGNENFIKNAGGANTVTFKVKVAR
jgi:hypothetical protein